MLYTNCRSLLPRIDYIRAIASSHSPHLIGICETWLDQSITEDELHIPRYVLTRRDRNQHDGGVAIFTHTSLSISTRLKHQEIELIGLDIRLKCKTVTCCIYYRPPSSNSTDLDELESTIEQFPVAVQNNLILMGDFNIDYSNNRHYPQLSSIQAKFGLKQVVSSPTRTTVV